MPEVSRPDGYIRLTIAQFRRLHFKHLTLTTDADLLNELRADGADALFAGSAEWVSKSPAPVSIGFAWYSNASTGHFHLAPGYIGANVMLVDRRGYDLGQRRTSKFISKWIKSTKWKRKARMLLIIDPDTELQAAGEINRKWREDYLVRIPKIKTPEELFNLILHKVVELGFEFAAYGIKLPVPLTTPTVAMFSNYPPEWQTTYLKEGYVKIDPTVRHAMAGNSPIVWTDDLFKDTPEFWRAAQAHGLRYGWAKASRDGRGTIGLLSLARSGPAITQVELDKYQDRMIWLADIAHAGMSRLLAEQLAPELGADLIAAEIEILRWSGEGKTASEVAQITGMSERNVEFHVKNAVAKLRAANKINAAVKAAALGLLA